MNFGLLFSFLLSYAIPSSTAHLTHSVPSTPFCAPQDSTSNAAGNPPVIVHGSRKEKKVALTFDACSTRRPSGYDKEIIRILIETRTPATLFLSGKWMQDHPRETREFASVSTFELGNHTYFHPHLSEIPESAVDNELRRTQVLMKKLTGKPAKLFRPPYGEYDDKIVRIASMNGLTTVLYDLASGDPDSSFTKERLIRYVETSVTNGSIIVMHMNGHGWHTAEALPEIIRRLQKKGFTFVTVSELARTRTR